MAISAFRFAVASTALLLATMFTGNVAYAQMSGGGDAPKAIDLARDPAWQVQESVWQSARYMQINHTTNGARIAVLQIDANGWIIQTDAQSPVAGRTVFRDNELEVIHYRQSDQDRWIIRPIQSAQ
jgi:hypothetical protein